MKKFALCIALAVLSSCSHHVTTQCLTSRIENELNTGKPILKVGEKTIYEGQINILMEIMPGFKAGWNSLEEKKQLVGQLIEQELFYQRAQEQDLITKNERLQKNLWLQVRNFEAGTYLLQEVDKRAREQYEKDKDQFYSQVEIRDIVFLLNNTGKEKQEDQQKVAMKNAVDLRKKLTSKNFAQMASQYTENQIAKADGGNIGMVSWIDQRVKFLGWRPLVERAFRMKKGKVSEPIATSEGVHIIQVISDKQTQTFEEASAFLRSQYELEVKNKLLEDMLKVTKIEYLDPTLAPGNPETK